MALGKFVNITLVVLGCVALLGCDFEELRRQREARRQAFEASRHSAYGENIGTVVARFGAPQERIRLPNGDQIYEWRTVAFESTRGGEEYEEPIRTEKTGTITNPDGTTSTYTETETTYVKKKKPVEVVQHLCVERFTVDKNGTILWWTYEGANLCY